jgi:hypothetical protein
MCSDTDRVTIRDPRYSQACGAPYGSQRTRILSDRLGCQRTRLKMVARLPRALLTLTTTHLADLALVMKPQVKTRSTYQRLQRFLAGFAFDYAEFGPFFLHLVPVSPPYVVVCDRTECHYGSVSVNVLMVGIAHESIALPISWTVLSHGGGYRAEEHNDLLGRFSFRSLESRSPTGRCSSALLTASKKKPSRNRPSRSLGSDEKLRLCLQRSKSCRFNLEATHLARVCGHSEPIFGR